MKWTFEQKMAYIKAYRNGEWVPVPPNCRSDLRHWHKKIVEWMHVLEEFGEEGLRHGGSRSFPKEARLEAVMRVESGESMRSVGYSLGMASCSSVLNWVRAYRKSGVDGLESKPKGRKSKHAQKEAEDAGAASHGRAGTAELHADPREQLLKKLEGLGGGRGAKPRQKYQAILETKSKFREAGLSDLLSVAKMAKSSYFYEAKRFDFDEKNEEIAEQIVSIFDKSKGRYGVRRVTAELRSRGFVVNHKKVQRMMRKMGASAKRKAVHYNSYKGNVGKVAGDLIIAEYVRKDGTIHHKSDFSCNGPNEKWTTDVSQFNLPFGKAYLSPIKDMYDGRIVAYDLSMRPDLSQAKRMLDSALALNPGLTGLILHSDQGWQYQHQWYVQTLKNHGILQSMSRKGNCLDNCIMESFFGTMKNEMFYGHEDEFKDFKSFKKAVDAYISWYNKTRVRYYKGSKKWMSPLACFEASMSRHPSGAHL